MWKSINLEDALLDDNYEDRGYAIFNDDAPIETIDGDLDLVVAKADLLDGVITIREEYYDKRYNEVRYSDIIWSNE